MKFLLDHCASSKEMREALASWGHDVLTASEIDPRASDEALLAIAFRERRTVITEDKDFGELVFVGGLPHPCIIRFSRIGIAERVDILRDIIDRDSDAILAGAMIVVAPNRLRISRPPTTQPTPIQQPPPDIH